MTESKPTVKLRVNVAGYAGRAATVFAAYDPNTDVLLIAREAEYEVGPRDGFVKITNQDRDAAFDVVFREDDVRDSITAFFELDALKLITFGANTARCNPHNAIDRLGFDEKGMKYAVRPDTTNAQVAVLAAALHAGRQRGIANTLDVMQSMRLISV